MLTENNSCSNTVRFISNSFDTCCAGGFVAPAAERQAAYPQQPGIVAYQPPASQQAFPAMAAQPTAGGKSFDYAGADEAATMAGFGEKAVRRAFIRKVSKCNI